MAMSYHFPYICGEKKGMSPPQALSTEVGHLVFCRAEIFMSQRATGGCRVPSPELLWNLGRRSALSRIFLGPLTTRQGWRHQAGMPLRVPGEPRSRDTCGAVQSLGGGQGCLWEISQAAHIPHESCALGLPAGPAHTS